MALLGALLLPLLLPLLLLQLMAIVPTAATTATPTRPTRPSWVVAIGYSNGTSTHCAGTLVATEWVVTAASCVAKATAASHLRVFVGCSAGPAGNCSSVHHVFAVTVHPCYRDGSDGNDVALVRLFSPGVVVGRALKLPVLPTATGSSSSSTAFTATSSAVVPAYTAVGTNATVYGWGTLRTSPLRGANLPFIASTTCKAKFLELSGEYSSDLDFATPRALCAGTGVGGGANDLPCGTDVGAPLVQDGLDDAAPTLVGVWNRLTPAPTAPRAAGLMSSSPQPGQIDQATVAAASCTTAGRYGVFVSMDYYASWVTEVVMGSGLAGTCAAATVLAANGSLAHVDLPVDGVPSVPVGLRYPWGDCPPSQASGFVGANMADASFVQTFGDASLRNARGDVFTVFEREYNDGYAATAPVGRYPHFSAVAAALGGGATTSPLLSTTIQLTQHGTYDMAGNVREWTSDVYDDTLYAKRTEGFGAELNVIVADPRTTVHPVEGCHDATCRRVLRGGSWADSCCHQPVAPNAGRDILATSRARMYQGVADARVCAQSIAASAHPVCRTTVRRGASSALVVCRE
jgi:secreted trypsin-like serine protease